MTNFVYRRKILQFSQFMDRLLRLHKDGEEVQREGMDTLEEEDMDTTLKLVATEAEWHIDILTVFWNVKVFSKTKLEPV